MRRILLMIALAAVAPLVLAQKLAESVEVTVIEVPVTVSDRGKAVRGLTAENFQVLVDGKPMAVEYFDTIDLTKVTSGGKALPAAAYRNFLLLFDVANSSPGTTGRAKAAAKAFIETQLGERDVAAVATFSSAQGARMVTSFTRDKALLLGAVTTLGEAAYFKVMDPLMLSANITKQIGANPPAVSSGAEARAEAEALRRQEMVELNERSNVSNEMEMRGRVRTQLQNLGGVARALDRLVGQKQIILLSEGFDATLLTGRSDLSFKGTQKENDALAAGEIWRVDGEQRFGSSTEARDLSDMAELFRRSDVRLHAIDIKGIRGADAKGSNESLFLLSRPTGGTVFRNDNDLSAQFAQLLEQQEVIYILAFKSRDVKPGMFHPVRVKLVGTKGELTHRSGYYDQAAGLGELEATLRFSQMLMTSTEVRDVPLSIVAMPVPGDEDSARVPVMVDVSGVQLLEGVTGPAVHANIFVYAFDEKGEAVDFLQQRIALDVARTGDAVRATGVRYVGGMRLPPGRYALKALVRVDETSRMGLTTSSLVVPAFGETALVSPVAMGQMGKWVTVVSPLRGAEATDVLTLERPFVPGIRAELADGSADFALMMRGFPVENLAVTPSLIGADGSAHKVALQLAGRTEPDEHGMSKLLFRWPAQDVSKGDYELRFTVSPRGGQPAVVSLPVVVR